MTTDDLHTKPGIAFPRLIRGLALLAWVAGPAAFLATLLVAAPAGLAGPAWRVAGMALWMALWWVSQPIPLAATALMPVVLLPAAGIGPVGQAAASYANPIIFLFLGGFLIALAIERCGLHRRLAYALLLRLGGRPMALVGGFMAVSALLSMWISNTATALMLLPVGASVLRLIDETDPGEHAAVPPALMLAIAYGASIGGSASLIGTPPNALTAAFLNQAYGIRVGFATWLLMALPLALAMLAMGWLLLCRVVHRLPRRPVAGARAAIRAHLAELGPMTAGETRVAAVALATAAGWILRPALQALPGLGWLSDTAIALAGALVLFLLPLDAERRTLDWEATRELPWGVLVLVGGGLALADAIAGSGLGAWIADELGHVATWPHLAIAAVVVAAVVVLTELTSNTATAATFVPLTAAVAVSAGMGAAAVAVPAAIAASCAFMLPVATPPNAIVYGSGRVSAGQMARAGLVFNLMAIVAISLYMPLVAGWLLG